MNYQIAAAHIVNFKRIREVLIKPNADRSVVLIAGKNAQGKSSVLDAFSAALGGKAEVPADPVRHGSDLSEVAITLDGNPRLTIRRRFNHDGTSTLEVRDELGAVKSPQKLLDGLIGSRFLDPLRFLGLKPPEQRAELLKLIDADGAIAELDTRRERVFKRRTEVARDAKKLTAQLAGMPEVKPSAPIDVAALAAEMRTVGDTIGKYDRACKEAEHASNVRNRQGGLVAKLKEQLEDLQRRVEQAEAEEQRLIDDSRAKYKACEDLKVDWHNAIKRRSEIEPEIKSAQEHNAKAGVDEAAANQRRYVAKELATCNGEHAELEAEIELIDKMKTGKLENSKLPVPGLGVLADALTFNGVPLAQASGAEQHRIALAIAIAAGNGLRDVWIRDGALLDDDSLEAIAAYALEVGARVWIERVGTSDDGAIIIHDGAIIGEPTPNAEAPTNQGSLFQ